MYIHLTPFVGSLTIPEDAKRTWPFSLPTGEDRKGAPYNDFRTSLFGLIERQSCKRLYSLPREAFVRCHTHCQEANELWTFFEGLNVRHVTVAIY